MFILGKPVPASGNAPSPAPTWSENSLKSSSPTWFGPVGFLAKAALGFFASSRRCFCYRRAQDQPVITHDTRHGCLPIVVPVIEGSRPRPYGAPHARIRQRVFGHQLPRPLSVRAKAMAPLGLFSCRALAVSQVREGHADQFDEPPRSAGACFDADYPEVLEERRACPAQTSSTPESRGQPRQAPGLAPSLRARLLLACRGLGPARRKASLARLKKVSLPPTKPLLTGPLTPCCLDK